MSRLAENDVLAVWVGLNSSIVQLWTMFVVGNFAACAFAISDPNLGTPEKVAMTIGFWLFAIGNLILIKQKLSVLQKLKSYMESSFELEVIREVARSTHPVWNSLVIHLFIDLCVTAIIWRSVFAQ